MFVNLINLIPKLQHAHLPPKCYKPRSMPNFLLFYYFHLRLTFESLEEVGSASIILNIITNITLLVHY